MGAWMDEVVVRGEPVMACDKSDHRVENEDTSLQEETYPDRGMEVVPVPLIVARRSVEAGSQMPQQSGKAVVDGSTA